MNSRAPSRYYSGYLVQHGTGRRLRAAHFGCASCWREQPADGCDPCIKAAVRFAEILGVGATVSRRGVVLHTQAEVPA